MENNLRRIAGSSVPLQPKLPVSKLSCNELLYSMELPASFVSLKIPSLYSGHLHLCSTVGTPVFLVTFYLGFSEILPLFM